MNVESGTETAQFPEEEYINGIFVAVYINPFLFIKNKRLFILSEGFSTLENNALICYQRAILPLQWGVTALCRKKWHFGALFV
jgi:hypothetical protein